MDYYHHTAEGYSGMKENNIHPPPPKKRKERKKKGIWKNNNARSLRIFLKTLIFSEG